MGLREYQAEDLDKLRSEIRSGANRILFEASVGYGKSKIIKTIAHGYAGRGDDVMVLSNRTAVVDQLRERDGGLEGIITSTVQGVVRRLDRMMAVGSPP